MPDASTFNTLLKGCMRARDARRAELVAGWMEEAGLPGDETTFNTLIKAGPGGCCLWVLSVLYLLEGGGLDGAGQDWATDRLGPAPLLFCGTK